MAVLRTPRHAPPWVEGRGEGRERGLRARRGAAHGRPPRRTDLRAVVAYPNQIWTSGLDEEDVEWIWSSGAAGRPSHGGCWLQQRRSPGGPRERGPAGGPRALTPRFARMARHAGGWLHRHCRRALQRREVVGRPICSLRAGLARDPWPVAMAGRPSRKHHWSCRSHQPATAACTTGGDRTRLEEGGE